MRRALRALREADEEIDRAVGSYERLRDYDLEGCELRSFVVSTTFPYTVFVAIAVDQIVILAVAHQHQEPGYWAERVGELGR
jgi:hypothetical protein